jgi:outer membrane lipoprotein-sorting protein
VRPALLIAISLLLPQEKNEAEELFKKMEGKLANAKTVQLKLSGEMQPMKFGLSGELLFDEGGKMRIEFEGKSGPDLIKALMLSDGKKLRLESSDKKDPKQFEVPETLGKLARACFARAGFVGTLDALDNDRDVKLEPDAQFAPKEFKLGAKEKVGDREAQAVDYKLVKAGHPESVATVWIDTETLLPLRRAVKMGEMALTENYSGLKLDGKIDAAKFELPKEK